MGHEVLFRALGKFFTEPKTKQMLASMAGSRGQGRQPLYHDVLRRGLSDHHIVSKCPKGTKEVAGV